MSAATVKHLAPTRLELEFEIPPAELEVARDKAFRRLSRTARMPGFRPGKMPRRIFEAQYGTGAIFEKALEELVPTLYERAATEHDVDALGRPEMELLPVEDGAPMRVRAVVTVRPEIALGTYKGLEIAGGPLKADDATVEETLERLRREAATLATVERPVALGDVPVLDFEGKIDGVPFSGGSAKNQPTELAADRFIPGFAEGIVGMSAGESKDVEATFPADYANAELAGKTAVFTVRVHENKVAELPAPDDDFAKRFGAELTFAQLRESVRAQLDARIEEQTQREMAERAIDVLVAAHDFELPEMLVERETEHLLGQTRGGVERGGGTWEAYLAQRGIDEAGMRAEMREQSARRVKTTLIIEAIAKAEGVRAASEDVDLEIEALSRHYGQSRDAVVKTIQQNPAAFVEGIVRSKTIALILDHAIVDGVAPADRAPEIDADAEAASASEATESEPA